MSPHNNGLPLARPKQSLTAMILVALLLLVSLVPIFNYGYFSVPLAGYNALFKMLLVCMPLAALCTCYRIDTGLPTREKVTLFLLLTAVGALLVDIHLVYIDTPSHLSCQYFPDITNADWQQIMHQGIMQLEPGALPHSYRFLPDSMVSLMTYVSGDFEFSKLIYRETFMFLLLFAIYYYSRLYYSHAVAIVTVLLYAIIYQISIREYAGQLTDPLSHLSFVLAFIFIELDLLAYLALTILFGVIAKETVIVMALYYVIKKLRDRKPLLPSILLLLAGLAVIMAIRFYVVPDFTPTNINSLGGVSDIIKANVATYYIWWRHLLFTVGIFLPFAVMGWKQAVPAVRWLIVYLLPVLIVSHVGIGFIKETRNLIPVVIPMALLTANYLLSSGRQQPKDE